MHRLSVAGRPAVAPLAQQHVLEHVAEVDVEHAVEDEVDREVDRLHEVGDDGRELEQEVVVVGRSHRAHELEYFRRTHEDEEEDDDGDEDGRETVTGVVRLVCPVLSLDLQRVAQRLDQSDVAEREDYDRDERPDGRPHDAVGELQRFIPCQRADHLRVALAAYGGATG